MGRLANESIPFSTNYLLNEYFKEVNFKRMLTKEEENDLFDRYHRGDKRAKDELIRMNLRFVILIVKQYQNKGLSLEDLINEGNIGLIKAIEKFDRKKDCKFISYAVWWIRQTVLQAISDYGHMIRLPLNKINVLNKCIRARAKITQEQRRNATLDEISEEIDMSASAVKNILNLNRKPFYADDKYTDDQHSTSFLDTLIDDNAVEVDNEVNRSDFLNDLNSFLKILNKKERYIIKSLFIDKEKKTLNEICNDLGIELARVKQILKNGFLKIKNSPQSYILKRHINKKIQETL